METEPETWQVKKSAEKTGYKGQDSVYINVVCVVVLFIIPFVCCVLCTFIYISERKYQGSG